MGLGDFSPLYGAVTGKGALGGLNKVAPLAMGIRAIQGKPILGGKDKKKGAAASASPKSAEEIGMAKGGKTKSKSEGKSKGESAGRKLAAIGKAAPAMAAALPPRPMAPPPLPPMPPPAPPPMAAPPAPPPGPPPGPPPAPPMGAAPPAPPPGPPGMKRGGKVPKKCHGGKMAKGGPVKYAKGGSVSSRGDGIAKRGRTNCKFC